MAALVRRLPIYLTPPSLGSTVQVSPSDPALRILLRAFVFARDALQRIALALRLTQPLARLVGYDFSHWMPRSRKLCGENISGLVTNEKLYSGS